MSRTDSCGATNWRSASWETPKHLAVQEGRVWAPARLPLQTSNREANKAVRRGGELIPAGMWIHLAFPLLEAGPRSAQWSCIKQPFFKCNEVKCRAGGCLPWSKMCYMRMMTWHWSCQEMGPAALASSAELACATCQLRGKTGRHLLLGQPQPGCVCPCLSNVGRWVL